jgi:hypothetical protein
MSSSAHSRVAAIANHLQAKEAIPSTQQSATLNPTAASPAIGTPLLLSLSLSLSLYRFVSLLGVFPPSSFRGLDLRSLALFPPTLFYILDSLTHLIFNSQGSQVSR